MASPRWRVSGALLLLALGVLAVVLSVTRVRQDSWWAGAFFGLVTSGLAMKWLRDIRVREAAK